MKWMGVRKTCERLGNGATCQWNAGCFLADPQELSGSKGLVFDGLAN